MITPRITRRAIRATAALALALAVSLVCTSWTWPSSRRNEVAYCAIMPDSIGLYPGNPVTQMGYKVGKVTSVVPSNADVRVDFTVIADRPLPADVRAVTRSASVLTDRALELVGNYESGPQLPVNSCITLANSSTPKSLSQIVGSMTKLLDSITPDGSTNLGDVVTSADQALRGQGAAINQLITTSSALLDAPEQAVGDMRSIVVNLDQLTDTIKNVRGPLKQAMLDSQKTTVDMALAVEGSEEIFDAALPLVRAASDLEAELGPEIQGFLDDLGYGMRKSSAHATLLADLLKPMPVAINKLENFVNRKQFNIRYRPPLYRIATPVDGLITCGSMNAVSPNSCTDVAGKPYAVDVALLQYVLAQAAHR